MLDPVPTIILSEDDTTTWADGYIVEYLEFKNKGLVFDGALASLYMIIGDAEYMSAPDVKTTPFVSYICNPLPADIDVKVLLAPKYRSFQGLTLVPKSV